MSLTSADSGVSQAAAKGLRILAETDRQPGAPVSSGEDREDRLNRNSVYEQLGDPNVMIVGMFRSFVPALNISNTSIRTCGTPETHQKACSIYRTAICNSRRDLAGVFLEMAFIV